MATRRADACIPKHTHSQAVTNPSEVATYSGTSNSRIVTRTASIRGHCEPIALSRRAENGHALRGKGMQTR